MTWEAEVSCGQTQVSEACFPNREDKEEGQQELHTLCWGLQDNLSRRGPFPSSILCPTGHVSYHCAFTNSTQKSKSHCCCSLQLSHSSDYGCVSNPGKRSIKSMIL